MEAMPNWLSQLISSGVILMVLGTLLKLLLDSLTKKMDSLSMKIEKLFNEIQDIKVSRAADSGEKKAEKELIWREINTNKHQLTAMKSSVEKLWEVMSMIASIKRPSDKIKEGE